MQKDITNVVLLLLWEAAKSKYSIKSLISIKTSFEARKGIFISLFEIFLKSGFYSFGLGLLFVQFDENSGAGEVRENSREVLKIFENLLKQVG